MGRFVEGVDRSQSVLFPERLEDYVGEDNPVRVVDAFVEHVDLAAPQTSNNQAKGLFGKRDFVYVPERDEYRCPAGQSLIRRYRSVERGMTLDRYWSSACGSCALKAKCTPAPERRISRWEHEDVLDAMQQRLDHDADKMRTRRCTVEHPFGTLKSWMGYTHFLTRTLEHVSTEMSLHVLTYNLKRVMRIVGIGPLLAAMQA